MKVTLACSDFRTLIQTACRVMESSDLGREAATGEAAPAFWLRADERTLTLDITLRGLEMCVQVDLLTCEEPGELAINPFMLKRMAAKSPEISLVGTDTQLNLKAGRFKSSIATIQNVKQSHYDEVKLTHRIPAKVLVGSLAATSLDGQSSQPYARFVWNERGARLWTHNAYNAAYAVVLDETSETSLDCVVPVGLLRTVADSAPSQDLRIGSDRSVLRFQNDLIDITHPVQTDIEIENIEDSVRDLDRDSIPHFEINPVALGEALSAVGSVDHGTAGSPQVGVDLWLLPSKKRLIVSIQNSVGESTQRVDLEMSSGLEDQSIKLNHKQLLDFTHRAKAQKLCVGILPDRTIMWAGTTTYVLAPVQEDQDV